MIKQTADEVAAQLSPGIIYLTKGTAQQVRALLPENVAVTTSYNPTTSEFRRWLIPNLLDDGLTARIIYYPKLEGTGRVKENGKKEYASVKNSNPYALPNDQTVKLPNNQYYFVLLTNPITGEIEKINSKTNLEGAYIQELDLRQVVFDESSEWANELPMTARWRAAQQDKLIIDHLQEDLVPEELSTENNRLAHRYIEQLLANNATSAWYRLGQKGEYYKWFLVETPLFKDEEKTVPLILNCGRAWCLLPYLSLFLRDIRDNSQQAPVQLARFATWINLATTTYASPGFHGLYWRQPRGSGKRGYWCFDASPEAKRKLMSFTSKFTAS
jgi:hypothetical protein